MYEEYLIARGVGRERLEQIEAEVIARIDEAAEKAASGRAERMPDAKEYFAKEGERQPGLTARVARASTSVTAGGGGGFQE
jgi:TPP-dependent pyruvate/acetoin dehydrogenase alpha subunit